MFYINIKKIKNVHHGMEKIKDVALIDAAYYGYDDFRLLSPCEFKGELRKEEDYINITGEVKTKVELICDSCGEPFSLDLTVPFFEMYSGQHEKPDLNGERDIHFASGEYIDIAPQILSQIYLELPMKAICRQDCRGLCQYCGHNLNNGDCTCSTEIDPRLEILKELNEG